MKQDEIREVPQEDGKSNLFVKNLAHNILEKILIVVFITRIFFAGGRPNIKGAKEL